MKIKGTQTVTHFTEMEVTIDNVLDKLKKELAKKFKVSPDWYINRNGYWEDWEDTGHGSGLTTRHREATGPEVDALASIEILHKTLIGN